MNTANELVQQVLKLPLAERERLVRIAWESLAGNPDAAADSSVDEAGLSLADQRDREIEGMDAEVIDAEEFRRRTS